MKLILGERYRDMLENGLRDLGQSVFWLPDNPDVDPRLAGHADLSLFRPDSRSIVTAEGMYNELVNILTDIGHNNNNVYALHKGIAQGKCYPADAGLCVCATGKYTIYNPKTIDPVAREYLSGTLIEVTQGYTKCSVSVVSDDAIITADDVIASRAAGAGMDVLKIAPGNILLKGFDHGFIGGATFLLKEDTLAFTGTLEKHPDKDQIMKFLQKHGVKPVFLTDEPIFDIGGAISV